MTDESGKVTKIYEYDSFGNEVKPDGKDNNPFRYCGEYYDKEMEEIYLRARYYQPAVGRFLTRDTYTGEADEPLSLHLYTYCGNDGVNSVDPSGHKIKLATKNKKKKKKILTTLYKLTGNKLKIMNKGHYKGYVLFKEAFFSPPLKYPNSMNLVIRIMTSNKICKITYDTKKVYYTKCKNIENASNGKGTSVTINFNPKQNVSVLTCVYNKKEGRYENKMKKTPAYIALGHELIHAYIDFDGSNVGVGTYSNEYKTVGLSKENYLFTENELREEHGLGRRLEY